LVSLILSERQAYFDDQLADRNNATSGRLTPICEKMEGEGTMPKDTGDSGAGTGLSRRSLFKQLGLAGAAAAVSETPLAPSEAAPATPAPPATLPVGEALETLTAVEADALEAIVARLIPTDENGPGATEARATHYIDRALAGPLASSRAAYALGLAAVDEYAQASRGAPFSNLSAVDQDAVLQDMEKNIATGFAPNSSVFFEMVRAHTLQGTFCDPYYGGNANFVGWDLIGYPGIRMAVSDDEQGMKAKPTAVRESAYDNEMFTIRGGGHGHQP
jgi:gluconate 2-dehydrogenase gamma chain